MGIKLTREQLRGMPLEVQAQVAAAAGPAGARSWSKAQASWCPCGRKHASRMERRVCLQLQEVAQRGRGYLLQQVRWPLPNLAGDPRGGGAAYLTVDFVLVLPPSGAAGVPLEGAGRWVAVDAKGGRRSRDWARGARAFRAWYGAAQLVEWDGAEAVATPVGWLPR